MLGEPNYDLREDKAAKSQADTQVVQRCQRAATSGVPLGSG